MGVSNGERVRNGPGVSESIAEIHPTGAHEGVQNLLCRALGNAPANQCRKEASTETRSSLRRLDEEGGSPPGSGKVLRRRGCGIGGRFDVEGSPGAASGLPLPAELADGDR